MLRVLGQKSPIVFPKHKISWALCEDSQILNPSLGSWWCELQPPKKGLLWGHKLLWTLQMSIRNQISDLTKINLFCIVMVVSNISDMTRQSPIFYESSSRYKAFTRAIQLQVVRRHQATAGYVEMLKWASALTEVDNFFRTKMQRSKAVQNKKQKSNSFQTFLNLHLVWITWHGMLIKLWFPECGCRAWSHLPSCQLKRLALSISELISEVINSRGTQSWVFILSFKLSFVAFLGHGPKLMICWQAACLSLNLVSPQNCPLYYFCILVQILLFAF